MAETVIIGGGVSGMAAAIKLKKLRPSMNVTVLEKNERILKKLAVSGNGQGNLSNVNIDINNYHGKNLHYFNNVFNDFSFFEFAQDLSLSTVTLNKGKIYPSSLKASSVCDLFRFTAEKLRVNIITDAKVEKIITDKKITVFYKKDNYQQNIITDYVICATGGASGRNLGTDGSSYDIYKALNYNITPLFPSLVQLKTELESIRVLKGVKLNCAIKLYFEDKFLKQSEGEILFTEYGISGPCVFDISGDAAELLDKGKVYVKIDFLKDYSFSEIKEFFLKRKNILPFLALENAFVTLLANQCVRAAINLCKYKFYTPINEVSEKETNNLINTFKNFTLRITGTTGFNNSQVTRGGISNDDIDDNLQSEKHKNLYFCGELLDIDGDCGGYNIHFALASGNYAARKIAEKL